MHIETKTVQKKTTEATFTLEEVEKLLRQAAGVPDSALVDWIGELEYIQSVVVSSVTETMVDHET